MRRRVISFGVAVAVGGALLAGSAQADFPYGSGPGFNPSDPTTYRILQGTPAPNDLGGNDWKYAATPEPGNEPVNSSPWELNGVRGGSVFDPSPTASTAWAVTTGRPDVAIAEFDSGVEWHDPGLVIDLRYKTKLNAGELPVPNHSGSSLVPTDASIVCASYATADDANGDGIFNLKDFACDSRINLADARRAGPASMFTPQDIIIAFSNGDDADGNGYVDDIAGWDFLDDDNDPYDDVHYGHGSGEARGGAGEVNNGGTSSPCPNCMITPFRVGDSFIADANRFAQAAVYAVDNDFQIIQEALGTLNNTRLSRDAVDYAYRHGVAVIASAADEAAQHHNYVSALPHTIVVNSVNKYPTEGLNPPDDSPPPFDGLGFDAPVENPKSYLTFNGCTNFSSKITVSIPSSSCSSNATEVAAGIAGLAYSAALNARDQGTLAPNPNCRLVDGSQCPITANEVRQLIATGSVAGASQVDDVNFTTSSLAAPTPEPACGAAPAPGCTDPNGALQANVNGVRPIVSPPDSRSYPARKGPDQFYGYGRINAYRAAHEASLGHVPPEVEITSPDWFAQVDPAKATQAIAGQVWARGEKYTCEVYVAPGSYPNNDPLPAGDMQKLGADEIPAGGCDGSTQHTGAIDGTLASVNVASLKNRFPNDAKASDFKGRETGDGAGQTSNGRPNSEPYGFTVRVVATTVPPVGGVALTGDDRRQLYLHGDNDLLPGFPKTLPGDGESSPAFADLDGDNRNELVFGTADGVVHAMRPNGSELPGWPAHTDALSLHQGHAYTSGEVKSPVSGAMLASIAIGDLDRDGVLEVVGADFEGKLYAWRANGTLLWKREANIAFSGKPLAPFVNVRNGHLNRTQHGFIGSPVLVNLDGVKGGPLEVVAAGMDRHVYAFRANGTAVPGYPALIVDHSKVQSIDPVTHRVTFDPAKTGSSNDALEADQGAIIDTPAAGSISGDAKPEIVVGTNEEYIPGEGNEPAINTSGNTSFTALGQTGILSGANGRLYALKSAGDADGNPGTPDWSAGGSWPVKLAILDATLLPVVGEGVTGAPVIGPATMSCGSNGGAGPKVGAVPNNGFGYILNGDGTSCYGQDGSGRYGTLQAENGTGVGQTDRPAFPAVGHPAFGNFAGGTTFLVPVAGLLRALDVVFPEYQIGSQDFVGAWDPASGNFRSGFPARMNDLQFLTGPSIGDIGGPAGEEMVAGSAYIDLQAYAGNGTPASAAWPKLTSGWIVANPLIGSFGTTDTDPAARKAVVAMTRDGVVFAYRTSAQSCAPSSWPKFHHDLANSGYYDRDATNPGAPTNVSYTGGALVFKAPGDDLLCGTADRYEVVQSNTALTGKTFNQGMPIPVPGKPKAAGQQETILLGGKLQRYLLVRAVDEQGNVGRPVRIDRGPPPPKPVCVDRVPPVSFIHTDSLNKRPNGLTVRGHTLDNGCRNPAVAKNRNAIAVAVSVAKRIGPRARERCRFLERDGKFGKERTCAIHTRLRAIGTYSLAKHRLDWRLPTGKQLGPDTYVVTALGADQSGNAERLLTKKNHKDFTVKKPKRRSSARR